MGLGSSVHHLGKGLRYSCLYTCTGGPRAKTFYVAGAKAASQLCRQTSLLPYRPSSAFGAIVDPEGSCLYTPKDPFL